MNMHFSTIIYILLQGRGQPSSCFRKGATSFSGGIADIYKRNMAIPSKIFSQRIKANRRRY